MHKATLAIISALSLFFSSQAQTLITGGQASGTWTLAGSPYYILASVMVPADSTLTIEPGVTVRFQGPFKLLVMGQVNAVGTETDSITFTAADTANGWQSIRFTNTPATSDTSRFMYCRIEYGRADGSGQDNHGGAFCFENFSKAVVSNCLITRCRAENGGGIYCDNSHPRIIGNTLTGNVAVNVGGGICLGPGSIPVIRNNTIGWNTAIGNGGGGIFCLSDVMISNNTIIYNTSHIYGGGGIMANGCSPEIIANTISNNKAPFGGGVACHGGDPNLVNNTITNNTADDGGGVVCVIGSEATLTNNTISNNSALFGGALYCEGSSSPVLRNTILWGNMGTLGGIEVYLEDEGSDPDFYHCDVRGGTEAFGLNFNLYTGVYEDNLNAHPLFVSPSGGSGTGFNGAVADWSLQGISPCINAGDPDGIYPPLDKAGNPRIMDGVIDLGAFEYPWPVGTGPGKSRDALLLFPNPAGDHIVVDTPEHSRMELLDIQGQVIRTIVAEPPHTVIFTGDLPAGAYLVRAVSGPGFVTGRFLKR